MPQSVRLDAALAARHVTRCESALRGAALIKKKIFIYIENITEKNERWKKI